MISDSRHEGLAEGEASVCYATSSDTLTASALKLLSASVRLIVAVCMCRCIQIWVWVGLCVPEQARI